MRRRTKQYLLEYWSAQVSFRMPYRAAQSQRANLGHPGGVGDEGQVETVLRSTVCLVITGCSTSGRKIVIKGDDEADTDLH